MEVSKILSDTHVNIDKIINMRAAISELKGLDKIKAQKDYYGAMEEFLNTPVCPICGDIYEGCYNSPAHIKPGIDGIKCGKCFKRGCLVNFVFRKDLMEERKKLL